MTEKPNGIKNRSRRAERLYAARDTTPSYGDIPWESEDAYRAPQQAQTPHSGEAEEPIAPPEAGDYTAYAPNEENAAPAPDLSAYYRRDGAAETDEAEPAFAPPPKLNFWGYSDDAWMDELPQETDAPAQPQANVYRPREATWADTERRSILTAQDMGYQVRSEEEPERKRRKRRRHGLRNLLIACCVLLALGGGAWLLRDEIAPLIAQVMGVGSLEELPFEIVTTPQPVRGYDAAPSIPLSGNTTAAIAELCGTLDMETCAVTDSHVLTRNARPDGTYDFYLFSSTDGRLLAYFEGLGPDGMFPQEGGGFYVEEKPYLVGANGSALVRTQDLEATLGAALRVEPMQGGWAIVQSEDNGSTNYINAAGQLLSTLWFCESYPFTGAYTVAYVDTGSTVDPEQRYLLYILGNDGTMSRWLTAADTLDVVASACGMAYMNPGDMYKLPDTSAPLVTTPKVDAYLDCGALVVQDPQTGKFGLYVHGEQHYDLVYDRIAPVECDVQWAQETYQGEAGSFTMHAVTGAPYPQPLSHSFVLEKDGQSEYVALSTLSSYPIRLEGEQGGNP